MFLWSLRFSPAKGHHWVSERDVSVDTAERWLKVFRECEPHVVFFAGNVSPLHNPMDRLPVPKSVMLEALDGAQAQNATRLRQKSRSDLERLALTYFMLREDDPDRARFKTALEGALSHWAAGDTKDGVRGWRSQKSPSAAR